ncbi:Probable cytochrome c oxidase polypeptide 4 [Microbacterium esteraromaticum]|uniref:cytochrome-c oxidase n=1 Tax=Microbacterium esteraromaticum TaxID=57043 RepID=A0A1R4IHH5_9MICO|nr:cytochrome c oxidase subunit 4 [Microbacterium esteraromaticum]SJN19231.1 Probable cytochrome c oxidase polypeptide 4 [Microbacterium esteraromaticum]
MRSNIVVWWIITAFFTTASAIYTVWSLLDPNHLAVEWVGTIALLFVGFMGAMIAIYLRRTYQAQGGELPEDVLTADTDDGDPELGEFAPWSWWPVVLAGSAAVFLLGLAVGHFLLPIGIAIFVVAIVGWVYEFYRGHFAR